LHKAVVDFVQSENLIAHWRLKVESNTYLLNGAIRALNKLVSVLLGLENLNGFFLNLHQVIVSNLIKTALNFETVFARKKAQNDVGGESVSQNSKELSIILAVLDVLV